MMEPRCNSSDRRPLSPDDTVASTYRVERVLGTGSMGQVVAAVDLRTGARVAIKCMFPEHARDESLVRRFRREALVGMTLKDEHSVRILGIGTLDPPREDAPRLPYMVMESLRGIDLGSLLRREGPLDPELAAGYIAQACVALAELHALGVVHRDVKPGNLFVASAPGGRTLIKLLDFGVARLPDPVTVYGDELTEQGTAVGTPSYMSPEQISDSTDVDPRADVWALGVTLYRLIAGTAPFHGDTTVDLALSIIRDEPPLLSAVSPDVPPGLDGVVRRCLAKRREDRYPSAKVLGAVLELFASGVSRWGCADAPPAACRPRRPIRPRPVRSGYLEACAWARGPEPGARVW